MTALKGDEPRTPIRRLDYQPPPWLIDTAILTLDLDPQQTCVTTSLRVRRNPDAGDSRPPLELYGSNLETLSVAVDGNRLDSSKYRQQGERLIIEDVPDSACLTTAVRIQPSANTALEGLYQSGDSLLTQCEAEGFRKITWFGDRPDIMSTFRVRLEADRDRYPLLLGNGNLVDAGELDDNRHYVVWDDPFPKPCYLFAVVAGDLGCLEEAFITRSGRSIALKVYSERDNLDQLDHAMASLKKAMAWDERRFGLEYDLDVYHVVATHDFNMGAMENKGLNIFNARYVLADPQTATDTDYAGIEAVIGHEYFHNWTGNRVTCRDWFQLTLKEGLTVFREQEFSADMQSQAVKRIEDVKNLMARQYPEDAGPMAHPVRPEQYVEINNFYTATVYEKGAEVVRMYDTLLGRDGFARGMDLYFERHDGRAVTCDDFRAAMADANDADLDQFARWYRQVGTPRLTASVDYDDSRGELELVLEQSLPDHPGNEDLGPLHIPVRLGLLTPQGQAISATLEATGAREQTHQVELREARTELRLSGVNERPVVSLLRGFTAPVQVEFDWSDEDLSCLLAWDPDPIARWMAGRRLSARVLDRAIDALKNDRQPSDGTLLVNAWRAILEQAEDDPALAATLFQIPTEAELTRDYNPVPVDAIHAARKQLKNQLAEQLATPLAATVSRLAPEDVWQFEPEQVGRRSLANAALTLLVSGGDQTAIEKAQAQYRDSDNMTDRFAALSALVHAGRDPADELLEDFERRYRDNPLVMDKWFAVQAQVADPETVETVRELMDHAAFSMKNPNKVRALVASFAMHNPVAFHREDGAGYRLVGEVVRELDKLNPQVAARLAGAFNRWADFDEARKQLMREQLEEIKAEPDLSADVDEIVSAALERDD